MAKKTSNPNNNKKVAHFSTDMELLTHKYSDYYSDKRNVINNGIDEGETLQIDNEEDLSYVWYDTREVYYPLYKSIVLYEVAKTQPIHPIIIGIFKIINELSNLRNKNTQQQLQAITQLDSEILGDILANITYKAILMGLLTMNLNSPIKAKRH